MLFMHLGEEASCNSTPYGTLNIYLFVCLSYHNMVAKHMKATGKKAVLEVCILKTV